MGFLDKVTVDDINVKGKKVLLRCDFNVPQDADGNITDFSESETALRQAMLNRASKRYFLCDSSKIGKTYLFHVCNIGELDDVFCDQPLAFPE